MSVLEGHHIMKQGTKTFKKGEIEKLKNQLRKWLEQGSVPNAPRDDLTILQFLQGCKYRLEDAKTKLKNNYQFRKENPQWFANRDPQLPEISAYISLGIALLLPHQDKSKPGILISRTNYHDPSMTMDGYLKTNFMIMDLAMKEDMSLARDGIIMIVDLKGTTFSHASKKMMYMRKILYYWFSCFPLRFQQLHFVNFSPWLTYCLNFIKSFMKEKLKKRIVIHKKVEDLKDHIDPRFLPVEYGGTGGYVDDINELWNRKINENRDWFLNTRF